MESTNDGVPAKRQRTEGREKTQLPQETMLQVLLWLDRFDLDGKQITARRLRSLVENAQMPLRTVRFASYTGDWEDLYSNKNMLQIFLVDDKGLGPADVGLQIETDADAEKAVAYLSSCFISLLNVYGHEHSLPKNAIIAAPALTHELWLSCNFNIGEADALSETLNGLAPRCLSLPYSTVPVWQINDKRLESLRLRGCNELQFRTEEPHGETENFKVTEEGILAFCFTKDDDLPEPERRALRFTSASITPAFFKKVVEASKNSQLTCNVELRVEHLRFDVGNLDVGVPPARSVSHHLYAGEPGEDIDNLVLVLVSSDGDKKG